jgi:hypothetical protein
MTFGCVLAGYSEDAVAQLVPRCEEQTNADSRSKKRLRWSQEDDDHDDDHYSDVELDEEKDDTENTTSQNTNGPTTQNSA